MRSLSILIGLHILPRPAQEHIKSFDDFLCDQIQIVILRQSFTIWWR